MLKCKYCNKELIISNKYAICNNYNCYFYKVVRLKYKEKPKSKIEIVKEKTKEIYTDIKSNVGNTLKETKETLNSAGIGYNKESDVFDTEFGRMDAGGL